ncbi:IclR family transcriptional regulator [Chelativorans salis]|uniref:IclR family transcriptional regulator n=1 Tax=Chelativorans salis TaxID=2978478 RepID=A0ABT2LTR6_9HYPH|nr:IclR family transcriptional regulator [Chelativorans sp. EGI FJ00035]MCT7377915.1 IclR family transcriptional regulator [Chelativorans sp. EGI FJ00035]
MSTVSKAISLLELFSVDEPELGLTEIARRSGFDKATTRRLLVSLTQHGFVEQDSETRFYRLGAGLTRLARIREARFPLLQTALPFIRDLAATTAETVHLSEASNGFLLTVHVEHPARANRVNVNVGEYLPLHSTASGIAFLAHAREPVLETAMAEPLAPFTSRTVTDPADLASLIEATRKRGFSISDQGYEEGVISVGAAILGTDGYSIGTLAIAAPVVRTPKAAATERGKAVAAAAREISERLNGESFEALETRAIA